MNRLCFLRYAPNVGMIQECMWLVVQPQRHYAMLGVKMMVLFVHVALTAKHSPVNKNNVKQKQCDIGERV